MLVKMAVASKMKKASSEVLTVLSYGCFGTLVPLKELYTAFSLFSICAGSPAPALMLICEDFIPIGGKGTRDSKGLAGCTPIFSG